MSIKTIELNFNSYANNFLATPISFYVTKNNNYQ